MCASPVPSLMAAGGRDASSVMLNFSLPAICVRPWQNGSVKKKWELWGQSCTFWGWGFAAVGYYGALGWEVWVELIVDTMVLLTPKLSACSDLGSVLSFRWENLLEVPTDLNLMIWKWSEVRPRNICFLGFIPSTAGRTGLAICWRSGLHRGDVRLN